jgi:hypothetical protein
MSEETAPNRWTLIRDIAVFQFKLVCDGIRDLLLVPISLVVGVVGLMKGGDEQGSDFYDLLRLGRRSERWINLFGAVENYHGPIPEDDKFNAKDIDQMVSHVESFIVDEYKKGGVTAQAKGRLDQALNAITSLAAKSQRKGPEDSDGEA